MGLYAFQFMSGLWDVLVFPPAAGVPLVDINGTALTMSQTVKLVGTIVGLDARDPHYGSVAIKLTNPNGTSPIAGETFFVDPSQVTVGS